MRENIEKGSNEYELQIQYFHYIGLINMHSITHIKNQHIMLALGEGCWITIIPGDRFYNLMLAAGNMTLKK